MITNVLLDIYKAYNEPHRHYHTLKHLGRMFEIANDYELDLTKEQIMSIWFHDYVYIIPKPDLSNELLSSIEARNYLTYKTKFTFDEINTTCTIIEDTEKELPTIEQSKFIIDLDLYNLSKSTCYFIDGALIEQEFIPVFGEKKFVEGRIKWINSMLERKSIFVSDLFNNEEMNENVIRNLKHDKALLEIRRDKKK
jgi:predicted metal-dependent HD superfamily phosphohydrolase